ncbi:hypothetical protein Hanom_Chr11g00994691 [Helianthus anomalus]
MIEENNKLVNELKKTSEEGVTTEKIQTESIKSSNTNKIDENENKSENKAEQQCKKCMETCSACTKKDDKFKIRDIEFTKIENIFKIKVMK